jgi:hypothetical protein
MKPDHAGNSLHLMLLALVAALTGCAQYQVTTVNHPAPGQTNLVWRTELRWDQKRTTIAGGKVWLVVDGRPLLISEDPFGEYIPIERADYVSRGVPNDAVIACASWWAGFGENLYLIRETDSKKLLIYSLQNACGSPYEETYELIKVFR